MPKSNPTKLPLAKVKAQLRKKLGRAELARVVAGLGKPHLNAKGKLKSKSALLAEIKAADLERVRILAAIPSGIGKKALAGVLFMTLLSSPMLYAQYRLQDELIRNLEAKQRDGTLDESEKQGLIELKAAKANRYGHLAYSVGGAALGGAGFGAGVDYLSRKF